MNGVFTRKTQIGTVQPLVYVTDQGNAALNPNIYLVFTYKQGGEERDPAVYMSYPQLFRLREVLETVKNLVADGSGFTTDNGELFVRPDCSEAFVLSNIGKKSKWISFKLVTISSVEEGISKIVPAVSMTMSDVVNSAAVLTVEEFLTVYTLIKDLDLASIQCQLSIAFLMGNGSANPGAGVNTGMGFAPQYQVSAPQYQAPPQQQYAYGNFGAPQQQRPAPKYNNYNGYQARGNTQPVNYSTTRQVTSGSEDRRTNNQFMQPQQSYARPVPQQMPPREKEQGILSFEKVSETPVAEVNYDDMDAINSIFED